jgi:trimethylamine:corrinoid methyltransferase-like protein
MDYQEYDKVYQQAVQKGTRRETDKATEEEWNILAEVTKNQIVKRIREELSEKK